MLAQKGTPPQLDTLQVIKVQLKLDLSSGLSVALYVAGGSGQSCVGVAQSGFGCGCPLSVCFC